MHLPHSIAWMQWTQIQICASSCRVLIIEVLLRLWWSSRARGRGWGRLGSIPVWHPTGLVILTIWFQNGKLSGFLSVYIEDCSHCPSVACTVRCSSYNAWLTYLTFEFPSVCWRCFCGSCKSVMHTMSHPSECVANSKTGCEHGAALQQPSIHPTLVMYSILIQSCSWFVRWVFLHSIISTSTDILFRILCILTLRCTSTFIWMTPQEPYLNSTKQGTCTIYPGVSSLQCFMVMEGIILWVSCADLWMGGSLFRGFGLCTFDECIRTATLFIEYV